MPDHEIRRALSGKHKGKGEKLHTHAVKYERAHNGGLHAHVERHTEDGAHHHTEHHVLANTEDAAEHLQEHMGDHPAMGELESAPTTPPPQGEPDGDEMAGAAAPGAGM
jgi:hypothetical protein